VKEKRKDETRRRTGEKKKREKKDCHRHAGRNHSVVDLFRTPRVTQDDQRAAKKGRGYVTHRGKIKRGGCLEE